MQILTVKLKSQKYILPLSSRHNLPMQHISEYMFCSLNQLCLQTKLIQGGKNFTKSHTGLLFFNGLMLNGLCDRILHMQLVGLQSSQLSTWIKNKMHILLANIMVYVFPILDPYSGSSFIKKKKSVHPHLLSCRVHLPSHCAILVFLALHLQEEIHTQPNQSTQPCFLFEHLRCCYFLLLFRRKDS